MRKGNVESKRIVSLNISAIRALKVKGETVYTGIFKTSVPGPVQVRTLSIEGDEQADLTVHGGALKAVYFYPHEHYPFWADVLGVKELAPGALGENFTCRGLLEEEAYIGDRWRLGTTVVEITQPRSPCYKLALKYDRWDLVSRFLEANRPGFYASVVQEGIVSRGEPFILESRADERISVRDVFRLAVGFDPEPELREAIVREQRIPEFWRHKVHAHGTASRTKR